MSQGAPTSARRTWPAAVGMAACLVLVAFLVRLIADPILGERSPFLLFVPAVLAAGLWGGLRAGVAAAAFSLVFGVVAFVDRRGEVIPAQADALGNVAAFVVTAVALLWLVKRSALMEGNAAGAQRQAADASVQHASLVDAVHDYAIFMLDETGRVASWNPGAERIKGWRADEIIGRHFSTFYTEPDLAAGKPAEELRVARAEGRFHEEGWRLRKDGSRFLADVTLTPLLRDGRLAGFVKVTRDITEREQQAEAIRQLARDLELRVVERTGQLHEANAELQAFAYSVAHDLRAPLRAMRGFSDALREDYDDRLDDTGREYLARIGDGAARLDLLIQDLLAYSRVTRQDIPLEAVPLDRLVDEAVEHACAILAERPLVEVVRPLPVVRANPTVLGQVLANLVSNAVKFVAPGRPSRLRVRAEQLRGRVRVWVEDDGIGIAPEHQERIFEVFQRLHGMTEYSGTGIGLAIVKKGVARMGGVVGVESAPGAGSRFWFELEAA